MKPKQKIRKEEFMNNAFTNNLFRNGFDLFDRNTTVPSYLRTDIYEDENAYYLKVEVPGMSKENLTVDFENGYLTITVKNEKEDSEAYIRKERIQTEMQRTFYIGEIKEDSIKANYENGLLIISLGKKEEPLETVTTQPRNR